MTKKDETKDPEHDEDTPKFAVNDRRHWIENEEGDNEAGEPQERLPSYVQQLKDEAEEKDKRLREYIAAYKDKNAENDEFRQRLQKENDNRLDQIKAIFFKKLIPILDNLKRAVDSAQSTDDFESFKQGVGLIASQFDGELKQSGVETVSVVGSEFDPKQHEVFMTVETEDPAQDNKVVEELEPGYSYKDKLIRPAKVKIAKLKI